MGKQELVRLRLMTAGDTAKIVAWRNRDFVRNNFIYQELFTEEGHLRWIREQVEPGYVVQFIICLADGREAAFIFGISTGKKGRQSMVFLSEKRMRWAAVTVRRRPGRHWHMLLQS